MKCATALLTAMALSVTSASFGADAMTPPNLQRGAVNRLGLSIDHGSLGVADIDKMSEWYQQVLGFESGPRTQRPQYVLRRLTIPGYFINLLQQKGSVRPTALMDTDKQGIISITFAVRDADAAYQQLVQHGVKIIRVSKDDSGKATSMHFTDPEGNQLEISQR